MTDSPSSAVKAAMLLMRDAIRTPARLIPSWDECQDDGRQRRSSA